MGHRVLVIEDDPTIVELLKVVMKPPEFEVSVARTLKEAIELFDQRLPHLAVVDVGLPDGSGLEACRKIRAHPHLKDTAILILTARTQQEDKIMGFESGSDDYVTKPFDVQEFLCRARALLRRIAPVIQGEMIMRRGNITVDTKVGAIFLSGKKLEECRPKEVEILYALMKNSSRVISRDEILRDVFGYEKITPTRTVDVHIQRLRQNLGDEAWRIKTISGEGYKFSDN